MEEFRTSEISAEFSGTIQLPLVRQLPGLPDLHVITLDMSPARTGGLHFDHLQMERRICVLVTRLKGLGAVKCYHL